MDEKRKKKLERWDKQTLVLMCVALSWAVASMAYLAVTA